MTTSFTDLGVPARMAASLAARGITEPSPIQLAALPDALAGKDVCGRAPTGSGKTLAFGLPVALLVGKGKPRHPKALVLVPTRELASQVQGELSLVLGYKRPVLAIYGGTSYTPQRRALSKGVDVVVACPGRLEDLVAQGDVSLDEVSMVVLDEADRMADMGFLPAVKRLLDATSPDRQTLLFSATLDGEVDKITRMYQRDPARHEVAAEKQDLAEVAHHFWKVERHDRVDVTAKVVANLGQAIVFCRTRHGSDRVAKQLAAAGLPTGVIHGARTQAQRERALSAFMAGKTRALVATDVAARGIHVDDVACVIHFDPVDDAKDYVHRSGRTGRAGAAGIVVSLVGEDQTKATRLLRRTLGIDGGFGEIGVFDGGNYMPEAGTPDFAAATAAQETKSHKTGRGGGSASHGRSNSAAGRPSSASGRPRRPSVRGAGDQGASAGARSQSRPSGPSGRRRSGA